MAAIDHYRADIDGLRAVAILPVLLFHTGIGGFTGGYVGVDVFFVISGYLITGIIAREIDAGNFSILTFYERRARRIMPVLIAVIAVVLVGATVIYLPGDFPSVPRSALAAALFLSNVSFFLETGYFQGAADTKPLLHTWSLAIEEQFYIGFPILLMLMARFAAGWRRALVVGIALVSFALAWLTQDRGDGFAFYLLPPRAWELFAGALLALGAVPAVRATWLREAIAAAGLAAIGFAVFTYDRHTVFPGVAALPPVLGAAALIHCAPGTRVGRMLSMRPLTAIGLISYSLYMWHWPLIVFVQYASDARLEGWSSVAVVLAAVAIAALSWRYIERPFRQRGRIGRRTIFAATGVAMAATCVVSGTMIAAGGWPGRFPAEISRMAAGAGNVSPDRERCHDSDAARGRPPCTLGAQVPPSALLWGDSHGVELAYVLSEQARRAGGSIVQRTQSSCPALIGYDPLELPRCARVNRDVLAAIRADPGLRTIYLAGFWGSYAQTVPRYAEALERTIATLTTAGRRVVLIGPVPSQGFDVPRRLAHLARFGRLDGARGVDRGAVAAVDGQLRALAARWRDRGVTYLSPADRLCDARTCAIVRDGAPLYFDSHHLSVSGARIVLAQPNSAIAPAPAAAASKATAP